MAITGFMESTLSTSEVFQGINENSAITNKAKQLIATAKHLVPNDLELAYIQVKQITDSLTRNALTAWESQRIHILYTDVPSQVMIQAIPYLTFRTPNGYESYIFANKYISLQRDSGMSIKATDLRDLLIGAYISIGLKTKYNAMTSNQYLESTLMSIYTKLMIRLLNKEYAISTNKNGLDTAEYWINRYFLQKVFGSPNPPDAIEKVAASNIRYMDEIGVQEIKAKYDKANPQKLSELLDLLKEISPRMNGLHLGVFISKWIDYYYVPNYLAMDNIEYLIFMIIALLDGNANIVNIGSSDIVKDQKNIKLLRGELLKIT